MGKIAFLFPGQGSQYVGMSKTLNDEYEIARLTFEEASDLSGVNLPRMCFEGSLADLGKIENASLALLTAGVASFRVYMKEIGIAPQFCAGHSLGEYTALTCSGAMGFGDALKIVSFRAKLVQEFAERVNGIMTVVNGLPTETIAEECRRISTKEQSVAISCYNSNQEAAISGNDELVRQVEDRVLELGGQITPLLGNPPFHCSIMLPASEQFREELRQYQFHHIRYPIIANLNALPYDGPGQVVTNLCGHLTRPVQWERIMDYLHKHGVTMTIEMGPKNVLGGLYKNRFDFIQTISMDWTEDRNYLFEFFGSKPMVKNHIPTVISKCLSIAASTPNYNFNNEEYQKGVLEPYRKIFAAYETIKNQGLPPSNEQMKEALQLLSVILKTKKIPLIEQKEWYEEIFEETGTRYRFPDFQIPT